MSSVRGDFFDSSHRIVFGKEADRMQVDPPDNANSFSQVSQLKRDCLEWVKQRLPVGLPPSARRAAIRDAANDLETGFKRELILKIQNGEITKGDMEELRFRMFRSSFTIIPAVQATR
jgi:hypothetical protein